jgi:ubiquinone/menaquinone biosynthesis C-methylase UbiE
MMLDLARHAPERGWDEAWWEVYCGLRPEDKAAMEQAAGVETSEAWQYLVSLSPDAIALDLGGGWGPLSCSLAGKVGRVYCIDPSLERLQLLRSRAEQRGLHNLLYLQAGDSLPLPFPDQFFDLVNVGGALQHFPCLIAGNPRRVQREMLQEIRRVLKPTGQVYAGVENRFALKFFQGRSQEGCSLRYATLMPRLLAHLYSLLSRGKTYRTYTYSAAGTARVFHQAGFASVQTVLLYPDHRKFDRVLAPNDAAQLESLHRSRSAWKVSGRRLLGAIGGLSWIAPAFGLVSSPEPDGHHFLEQIVKRVSCTQQASYEIVETNLRDYGGCVVFLRNRDEANRSAILKLALDQRAENALSRAMRNVTLMSASLKGGTPPLPRILENGIAEGHAYLLEERLAGCNGWEMIARGWSPDRLADIVWDFLEGWMRATHSTVRLNETDYLRWIPYQSEDWYRLAGPRTARAVGELIDALGAYMVGQERVVVASHGDFSLGNVLFHETTGTLAGIVDWDSADTEGLPLVDAISLSQYRYEPAFDLGFPDEFADGLSISTLAEALRRVSTCPGHPRFARARSEYGYETDRDAFMALFLLFLKRHQSGSLSVRKQIRKWVDAFRLLVAV